jgi:hypothetical protein
MVYAVGVLAALVLGESWLLWRVGRALGPLAHFADRLAQLSGAVNLLTETAESGFVSFAGVLNEAMQTSPDRRAPRAPRVSPDRTAETAPAPASDVTAPQPTPRRLRRRDRRRDRRRPRRRLRGPERRMERPCGFICRPASGGRRSGAVCSADLCALAPRRAGPPWRAWRSLGRTVVLLHAVS